MMLAQSIIPTSTTRFVSERKKLNVPRQVIARVPTLIVGREPVSVKIKSRTPCRRNEVPLSDLLGKNLYAKKQLYINLFNIFPSFKGPFTSDKSLFAIVDVAFCYFNNLLFSLWK